MSELRTKRIDADRALYTLFDACDAGRPYTLFDVRDAEAYHKAHIPGAELLGQNDVIAWAARLPKDAPIFVYCYHGHMSQGFAKLFVDLGFPETYSIDGGFHDLLHAFQRALKRHELANRTSAALKHNA